MSQARDRILNAVRLGRAKQAPPAPSLKVGRQALLPPRFVRDTPDLVALFLSKLEAVSATHVVLPDLAAVPDHLAAWLAARTLPVDFILAAEPRLSAIDWASAGLRPALRAPEVLAPATIVSGAFAGVAETGSVALVTSGQSRPSHNLLADSHIVIIERAQILPAIEDVWRAAARGGLPRSLAFITGPSRTADIEMSMELGVHGAVRLHVIVIGRTTTGA